MDALEMTYTVYLWRHGARVEFSEALLLPPPAHVVDLMEVTQVDGFGLCDRCELASRCHVLQPWRRTRREVVFRKLCPVLFHDAVRPSWRLNELL